jgi:exosortase/archaeosortase family protein
LGWKKLKIIGFALFFILTLFPVPHFINTRIMLQLRMISSKLGVAMIQAYGLPVARQGNIIDLGFTKLQVVDACSGLHSLISLVVLCLLIVYFFKDHIWKRIVLLFSSIPLAIVTNSMRIAMTAVLYKHFGAGVAEGFFHEFSGLLIFAICIPVLLLEMKILEKLPPVQSTSTSEPKETKETVFDNNPVSKNMTVSGYRVLRQPMFIVAVILLGATLSISQTVDFREKIPTKKNLDQFPLKVEEWAAERHQAMAQKFIDVLDLSEYVIINYQNLDGK